MCESVEGQKDLAGQGQKAFCARSHGCIKQGMKYSNMAVHLFQRNLHTRLVHRETFRLSTPIMHADWSRSLRLLIPAQGSLGGRDITSLCLHCVYTSVLLAFSPFADGGPKGAQQVMNV